MTRCFIAKLLTKSDVKLFLSLALNKMFEAKVTSGSKTKGCRGVITKRHLRSRYAKK